jgi:acetyl-CoA carboxylase carboxyl transferase subunit beta
MLDRVVARKDLRDDLAKLVRLLTRAAPYVRGDLPAPVAVAAAVEEAAPAIP